MYRYFFCLMLFVSTTLFATQPYQATVTVSGESAEVGASCILNLLQDLKNNAIQSLIPFYTPTSATSFSFNLRGMFANGNFALNSPVLVVSIPQVGITETFSGATRDESLQLFESFIRNSANGNGKFLRAHARFTPIDPIAGNPNSLQSQMAQADYLLGRLSPLSGCSCCWSAQPVLHQFQGGMNVGRAFCREFDTTIITLPLRYSYSPDRQKAFIVDLPFTLLKNGGAYLATASLGLGYRYPVANWWSLTPLFRVGAGNGIYFSTGGAFFSWGVANNMNFHFKNLVLTMTNFVGYYCSSNLHIGGVNFNYHLHNWIFKNGLYLTTCNPLRVCGRDLHFDFHFIDSEFRRDVLFINHYDEVGIALIAKGINPRLCYDLLSLGFSYQFGKKGYKGYFANLLYQF